VFRCDRLHRGRAGIRPIAVTRLSAAPRAVVFGYHNVGARGLRVLLAHGVDVPLVVTHLDKPREIIWFESVLDVACDYGIPAITPTDVNAPEVLATVAAAHPDFLFSFYYRQMLAPPLLAMAPRGALNLHGSLLPRYRGRAPVNWAVLHGERETGASLHYMVAKPDAGDLVAQTAVPILPDDTAREVFDKVKVAAEITLDRALPGLLAGSAPRMPLPLAEGSYFGGRTAADGRIDWTQPAAAIHNLVRAVAPPYPGAGTRIAGHPARVLRTRVLQAAGPPTVPALAIAEGTLVARCGGGGALAILALEVDGTAMRAEDLAARLGGGLLSLEPAR
jgi:methionyl-tRNA formyltransferase